MAICCRCRSNPVSDTSNPNIPLCQKCYGAYLWALKIARVGARNPENPLPFDPDLVKKMVVKGAYIKQANEK